MRREQNGAACLHLPRPLQLTQPPISLRSAVAKKLPDVSHFADLVEIQVGDDELVAVSRRLSDHLPPRIAEIALAIELTDVPRLLEPDAIDRPNEERVCDGVGRLLELPQIF